MCPAKGCTGAQLLTKVAGTLLPHHFVMAHTAPKAITLYSNAQASLPLFLSFFFLKRNLTCVVRCDLGACRACLCFVWC